MIVKTTLFGSHYIYVRGKMSRFVTYNIKIIILFLIALTFSVSAQESVSTTTSSPRVWSLMEVLAKKPGKPVRRKVRYCNGGRFQPCVCWRDVARDMRYRPALKECDGNAAIILTNKYYSIFSAVVRDSENRDRWPVSGFNDCTLEMASGESPPAYCSAFKTQKRLRYEYDQDKRVSVHCLGASGYSDLFDRVTRVTIKLADVPSSNADPLVRWCLRAPDKPLN